MAKAGIEIERSTRSAMACTAKPSASLTNDRAWYSASKSTLYQSPPRTCSVAIKIGHGLHQQSFDGAFQVPRAVFQVRSFLQQKALGLIGSLEDECSLGRRVEDALLDHVQFNVQNLLEFVGAKRLEGDDLVQPIDEFRRELPPGRFSAAAMIFPFSFSSTMPFGACRAASPAPKPSRGFMSALISVRAQVAGHEDHAPGRNPPCGCRPASTSLCPGCPATGSTAHRWPFRSRRTARS